MFTCSTQVYLSIEAFKKTPSKCKKPHSHKTTHTHNSKSNFWSVLQIKKEKRDSYTPSPTSWFLQGSAAVRDEIFWTGSVSNYASRLSEPALEVKPCQPAKPSNQCGIQMQTVFMGLICSFWRTEKGKKNLSYTCSPGCKTQRRSIWLWLLCCSFTAGCPDSPAWTLVAGGGDPAPTDCWRSDDFHHAG